MTSSRDPTHWPPAVKTGVLATSFDVKYAATSGQFMMFYLAPHHGQNPQLYVRHSNDGVHWQPPAPVPGGATIPHYAHNLGVSGDRFGHLIDGRALAAYGAPWDLIDDVSWARWDLHGTALSPSGRVWNDVPWGWHWQGWPDEYELALGDYDGDGKTDRAIVNPATVQWYILGSDPFQIY